MACAHSAQASLFDDPGYVRPLQERKPLWRSLGMDDGDPYRLRPGRKDE